MMRRHVIGSNERIIGSEHGSGESHMACFIGKNDFSAVLQGRPMNRTCGTGSVFLCPTVH